MKWTATQAFVLALLLCLRPDIALGADYGTALFRDEVSKQEKIYQSHGPARPNGYVIDRSLMLYAEGLCTGFRPDLAALGPSQRWLDIGAGQGQAVIDYVTSRYDVVHYADRERPPARAQVVAMSVEDRRTLQWQQTEAGAGAGKLRYLAGKRLREYSPAELGTFQLITDVVGGFSYSVDLSLFVQQVLSLLDVDGSFYTLLGDVQFEKGGNKPYYEDTYFLTDIRKPDGSEVRMCSWLKSISCVEVQCEPKDWQPPVESFRIRKICSDVKVPPLLPVHYEAGTPPGRRYLLTR
jgi:SAM-dependent methyltransferase